MELSSRVGYAVRFPREIGAQKGLRDEQTRLKTFDANWDRGQVVYRANASERLIRILQWARNSDQLEVCTETTPTDLLNQELQDVKLREKIGGISDPPRVARYRVRGRRCAKDVRDLAVLGWNARGVLARLWQQFPGDAADESNSHLILVQEWCAAGGAEQTSDGYVAHASPPSGAWQRCAIAVGDRVSFSIVGEPQFHARSMHLDSWTRSSLPGAGFVTF